MNVIVLAAGTSTERDISIVSGSGVAKALKENGHNVFIIDAFFGCTDEAAKEAFVLEQDIDAAASEMKENSKHLKEELSKRKAFFGPNVIELCMKADKVFIALHGMNGEDGRIQGAFDLFGISYTGTGMVSSALSMDKGLTKHLFKYFGVDTPKGRAIKKGYADKTYEKAGLSLPVVVKPSCGGSSIGVTIAHTDEEYQEALKNAFALDDMVIVEEYVKGREFSVAVVDGKAYPVIEIIVDSAEFYDLETKYNGKTREVCPAELTKEQSDKMQSIAELATVALGITGYCRFDFLMKENGDMYCLEANTIPGMTPTSLIPQEANALGISYNELCEMILNL